MRRFFTTLVSAFILPALFASLLFVGCGSADGGDYEREVADLNEAAAEELEELSHHLSEEEHETGEERTDAAVAALEEAVTLLQDILVELEEVKVPCGREDFHRALLNSYHAELSFYEGLAATLEPGDAHSEDGEHSEEEESQEEETGQSEEEAPHEEEPAADGSH